MASLFSSSLADTSLNTERERFPFPGAIGPDGKHQTRFLIVDGQKKRVLKEWCQEFRLPHSGNIATMTKQLKEFSADHRAWDSLLPGARRPHKGSRAGAKRSKPKQSVQRREQLLDRGTSSTGAIVHALPTERSRDTRTPEEIAALVPWAKNFVAKYPYRPPQPLMTPNGPLSDSPPAYTSTNNTDNTAIVEHLQSTNTHLASLLSHFNSLSSQTSLLNPHFPGWPAPVVAMPQHVQYSSHYPSDIIGPSDWPLSMPVSPPVPPLTQHAALSPDVAPQVFTQASEVSVTGLASHSRISSSPQPAPLNIDDNSHRQYRIRFRDNTLLTFTQAEVPDPPAVSFADNIPKLNAMWDDSPEHWGGESCLSINGRVIPLVYWPEVYRYGKKRQWQGTKAKWHEWKVVVERWRKCTPAEFWAAYSDTDGKHLTYTSICGILRKERLTEDNELSERVKVEYGPSFATYFSYRRGGQSYVMTDPTRIANKYREISRTLTTST